jgi:hypothetical protein
VRELEKYVDKYYNNIGSDLRSSILHLAETYNLWDAEMMIVINRVKEDMERFDFLAILSEPRYYDGDTVKMYKKVVNQMLLFRKLYKNQFPDFDIVEATPIEVYENMYPEYFEKELTLA